MFFYRLIPCSCSPKFRSHHCRYFNLIFFLFGRFLRGGTAVVGGWCLGAKDTKNLVAIKKIMSGKLNEILMSLLLSFFFVKLFLENVGKWNSEGSTCSSSSSFPSSCSFPLKSLAPLRVFHYSNVAPVGCSAAIKDNTFYLDHKVFSSSNCCKLNGIKIQAGIRAGVEMFPGDVT